MLALLMSFNVWGGLDSDFIYFDTGKKQQVKLYLEELSEEEFIRINNRDNSNFNVNEGQSINSVKANMTSVKDQGRRGTCNVFSSIALLEFYERGDLSEQCLAWFSSNEDPGAAADRIEWALENGLYNESDCLYDGRINGRSNIPDLREKTKVWPDGHFIFTDSSIDAPLDFIKGKIDEGHPVIASVYVAGDDWLKQKIIQIPTDDELEKTCNKSTKSDKYKKCAGHAVVMVGYNDDDGYLEFKNSWGPSWPIGEKVADGYGKMSYSYYLKMRKSKMVSK